MNHRPGEDRVNRLGKAAEPVDHRDQDVLDPAALELHQDPLPEGGPFRLGDPEAQHLLLPTGREPQGEVHGLVLDQPFVADLQPQRIEHHGDVDRRERALLPRRTSSQTASVTAEITSGETGT